jgi:alpha-tubulin suppressor-like RCC1 family protein
VALKSDGSVVGWGSDASGQATAPGAWQRGVVAIAEGRAHRVALKSDGTVVAWGMGKTSTGIIVTSTGGLIVGEYGQSIVPPGLEGVTAIAAGAYHTVCLKNDGSVVAWGLNESGQTDVPEAARSGVMAIAAGNHHTMAIKTDGTVVGWGSEPNTGQLSIPTSARSGVTAIAAGWYASMALKTNGAVVVWGSDAAGLKAVPSAARSGVVAIAAGGAHMMVLKTNGAVVAWGDNNQGQMSVPLAAKSGVVAIAAGGVHSVALKSDGSIVAWGTREVTENWDESKVPVGFPPALAVAAGEGSLAIVRDPQPSLTLLRNADRTLSLSWSGAGLLELTESLAAPDWRPAPSQANPQSFKATEPARFFRLKAE